MFIVEPTIIDLSMTLVIATIGEDGIVISADGKAQRKESTQINFEKIVELKDSVYIGVSGQIVKEDFQKLIKETREKLDFSFPYSIHDLALNFRHLALKVLGNNQNNQHVEFLMVGYDKNEKGKSLIPHIFQIDQYPDNEYGVYEEKGLQEVSIGRQEEYSIEFPANTEKLVKYTQNVIEKVSKLHSSVGPPYKTVIIKKNEKKEIFK